MTGVLCERGGLQDCCSVPHMPIGPELARLRGPRKMSESAAEASMV